MDKNYIREFREVLRRFEREIFFQKNESCCNGVTLAQCHTLLEIENKGKISVTDLAKNLSLDKSTISRTVDGLVNMGFVERTIPENNRRMATISLTQQGKKTGKDINCNSDKYIQDTLAVLDEKEKEELLRLLSKITLSMSKLRSSSEENGGNMGCC